MSQIPDRTGLAGSLLTATGFLTSLPVRHDGGPALGQSVAMFPVVGAGVGLAGAAGFLAARWLGLGDPLAALAAVLVMLALTRALHEDGLADFADGLAVHGDRARRLAAMRDSRIGAAGALALIAMTGIRVAALAELAESAAVLAALVAAGAFSRSLMAVAMRMMPAAREDGLAAGAGTPGARAAMVSLAVGSALAVVLLLPWTWLAALAAGCLGALAVAGLAKRLIGGKTGDVLGAIQQAAEAGVLAGAVSMA